jgi:hypothetical protein
MRARAMAGWKAPEIADTVVQQRAFLVPFGGCGGLRSASASHVAGKAQRGTLGEGPEKTPPQRTRLVDPRELGMRSLGLHDCTRPSSEVVGGGSAGQHGVAQRRNPRVWTKGADVVSSSSMQNFAAASEAKMFPRDHGT